VFPSLVADMNIAVEVIAFLRARGIDVVSAREPEWGDLTDSEILAQAHAQSRFVMTHDSDFATLAVHRGEPVIGMLYLRPGGRCYGQCLIRVP
jgi:predicted nuclease of predicted toxin-antitoxin system